ncbi:hypothetical protein TH61_07650 [Rufibacter sp. DG15C]|uniref:hypothetical protein n=1 Tax=Rufibacter sp. DG15C TaxID=1379909 RepID=UPI00078DCD05|nr:hypothetical protein [Rufibacter sp. DG15C]AMM51076.1 hypothetical protein TH61_07650 [Rufibacter sp. DG15C]
MKKILLLFLYLSCFDAYSQKKDLSIEQSAVNFLGTDILPKERKVSSFRYDGKVILGFHDIESSKSTLWMLSFCKISENKNKERAGVQTSGINWVKKISSLEKQLQNHLIDTTFDYSNSKLTVPKVFTKVSKGKNRKIRYGKINHYWRKWRYDLFGSAHYITVYNAIEFDELYLVYINTHATHDPAGLSYYILLNKDGNVTDWCRTTWIS